MDDFIIGYCGRNQHRKNLPALFDVFYRFNAIHRNSTLYLHTEPIAPPQIGWNLVDLIDLTAEKYTKDEEKKAEIFDKILFSFEESLAPSTSESKSKKTTSSLPPPAVGDKEDEKKKVAEKAAEEKEGIKKGEKHDPLCKFYNTLSANVSATKSEGFCLPIIESMACGIPQVVPDHTTLPELCEGCGELVKIEHEIITSIGTINYQVDIEDFVKKLERLYDNPQLCEKYSKNAVKKAKGYDYSKEIIPKWLNLIDKF